MAFGGTQSEAASRSALIDVLSYDILLDLASDPGAVRSRTEIRFSCREPGASTYANLSTDTMHSIQLNGQAVDPAEALSDGSLHLAGLASGNVLTVDAESSYRAGDPDLSVFTDPADGSQYMLATCDAVSAPRLFCCFNQMDLLAGLTLSVVAPPGWECVSHGALTARPEPGQAGVWRFATVPAMNPSGLCLCAGPYVTAAEENLPGAAGPIPLRVLSRRSLAQEPGLARIADTVSRSLAFYERLTGVPCPYPKFDVVFAPALAAGAMQDTGLMLVGEKLLQRAADSGDDSVTLTLAHEVAHLWFGCLVVRRWWDDLWLSEALADYLCYTAGDEALGLSAVWARYGMRSKPRAYQADSAPGVQPVSSPVDNAAEGRARPTAITYLKGGSVVRQLAALIGDDALRAGLHGYLTTFGGTTAVLGDLVGCWSRASGRDLAGWAEEWLRTPGVNTLRPELTLAPDGTIASLAIVQDPPPGRTHRVSVGLYVREGDRLHRRHRVSLEIEGSRTAAPDLSGHPAPDALILNDDDCAYARIRFDGRSLRALTECALDVGDPLAEAVCWTAVWDMIISAEMTAADFIGLAVRRIAAAPLPVAPDVLLQRALTAADYYAPPTQRSPLRQRLAAAALDATGRAQPASRTQRQLAAGFAASAESASQLTLLRSWLPGAALPDGLPADLELRAQILATLSARGLATDAALDAYVAADPVGGQVHGATCRAMRPDPEAKETAWTAALDAAQTTHLAIAHATGIWVPGQEAILAPYRTRYFTEALPALSSGQIRVSMTLSRLLYPHALADPATLDATETYLAEHNPSPSLGRVLLEQAQILRQAITAQAGQAG